LVENLAVLRVAELRQREGQIFLVLALVIGALTGLAVVAFIMLTERLGMRLYPAGGAPCRRLLFPVVGSLGIGYLLYRYFPNARGSGVPQTKAAHHQLCLGQRGRHLRAVFVHRRHVRR
jgi:chloride channel protein, CIC family